MVKTEQLLENSSRPSIQSEHKVWITRNWYARVDEFGHVIGTCAQGALGFVIQLYPGETMAQDDRVALKVPLLRADTLQENAHICQILETEANSISRVKGTHAEGLVQSRSEDRETLMTLRTLKHAPNQEARLQDGAATFLSFGKDNRIRLCNVRMDKKGEGESLILSVYPDTEVLRKEFSILGKNPSIWHEMECRTTPVDRPFTMPVFMKIPNNLDVPLQNDQKINQRDSDTKPNLTTDDFGPLYSMLSTAQPATIWYAGVPSVMFQWAKGTLQYAISRGWHQSWTPREHYQLIIGVLRGIAMLHKNHIIHGDIRPANIMALDELNKSDRYRLGDYGSFTADQPPVGDRAQSGHTTGPGITRHRTSPFYARERRSGIEREDADVAILINKRSLAGILPADKLETLDDREYFLRLDWKGAIVEPETNTLKAEVLEEMANDWIDLLTSHGNSMATDWPLRKDDQVRIRDFLFRIIDIREKEKGGRKFNSIRCSSDYFRVIMEKISAPDRNEIPLALRTNCPSESGIATDVPMPASVMILDLQHWVEIRQPSVASDIFSVGVLALYLLYAGDLALKKLANSDEAERTKSANSLPAEHQDPERALSAIVRRLEDENVFRLIWPQLSSVCARIESAAKDHASTDELLSGPCVCPPANAAVEALEKKFGDDVLDIFYQLLSVSPELNRIFLLIGNQAQFLLFIHFVLSCMHRRADISHQDSDDKVDYPFCLNRFEQPAGSTSANRAEVRLELLKSYFDPQYRLFKDFSAKLQNYRAPSQTTRRLPVDDAQERSKEHLLLNFKQSEQRHIQKIETLTVELEQLRANANEAEKLRNELHRAHEDRDKLLVEQESLNQDMIRLRKTLETLETEKKHAEDSNEELTNVISKLQTEVSGIRLASSHSGV